MTTNKFTNVSTSEADKSWLEPAGEWILDWNWKTLWKNHVGLRFEMNILAAKLSGMNHTKTRHAALLCRASHMEHGRAQATEVLAILAPEQLDECHAAGYPPFS